MSHLTHFNNEQEPSSIIPEDKGHISNQDFLVIEPTGGGVIVLKREAKYFISFRGTCYLSEDQIEELDRNLRELATKFKLNVLKR